jgi:hypothetical protein
MFHPRLEKPVDADNRLLPWSADVLGERAPAKMRIQCELRDSL